MSFDGVGSNNGFRSNGKNLLIELFAPVNADSYPRVCGFNGESIGLTDFRGKQKNIRLKLEMLFYFI